jgi:hypothetical protein
MSNHITISRKGVKEMIVRTALKNEEFRESLLAWISTERHSGNTAVAQMATGLPNSAASVI